MHAHLLFGRRKEATDEFVWVSLLLWRSEYLLSSAENEEKATNDSIGDAT